MATKQEGKRLRAAYDRHKASRDAIPEALADRNRLFIELDRRHPGMGAIADMAAATGLDRDTIQAIVTPARGVARPGRQPKSRVVDRLTPEEYDQATAAQVRVEAALERERRDKYARDQVFLDFRAHNLGRGAVTELARITGLHRTTIQRILPRADELNST